MEQVMLSKIMVSIARYNAVADTCASSDQHAQGLMSCCSILTLLTLLYLISILLYDTVITQSTSKYALSWAAAPSSSQADVAMWLSTYCSLLSRAPESKSPINGADRPLYLHT